ncbi:MAG: HAD family hydrolase [Janthinobacterium lividum]
MTPQLSRPWDAFDAYLFDIDGTLLNCQDAVHYFAFCDALSLVAARPLNLDGVVTHGNTDQGILRDAFAKGGVEEAVWRPRLAEIQNQMGAQVETNRGELRMDILPGVRQLLAHLRSRGGMLSTATGNFARIGEAKLKQCGLREFFDLGGYSDGFETRAEVFRAALAAVRERTGSEAAVCVFGDTPADVQAAHANGIEVIAVATGIYSREQLEAEGPELCLSSLEELVSSEQPQAV